MPERTEEMQGERPCWEQPQLGDKRSGQTSANKKVRKTNALHLLASDDGEKGKGAAGGTFAPVVTPQRVGLAGCAAQKTVTNEGTNERDGVTHCQAAAR